MPTFLDSAVENGQEPGLLSGGYTPSKMLLTSRGGGRSSHARSLPGDRGPIR